MVKNPLGCLCFCQRIRKIPFYTSNGRREHDRHCWTHAPLYQVIYVKLLCSCHQFSLLYRDIAKTTSPIYICPYILRSVVTTMWCNYTQVRYSAAQPLLVLTGWQQHHLCGNNNDEVFLFLNIIYLREHHDHRNSRSRLASVDLPSGKNKSNVSQIKYHYYYVFRKLNI